jgi:hypothetical protein
MAACSPRLLKHTPVPHGQCFRAKSQARLYFTNVLWHKALSMHPDFATPPQALANFGSMVGNDNELPTQHKN